MLSGQAWLERVSSYLPFSAGNSMIDLSHGTTGALLASATSRTAPLVGGAVFLGTIGVLVAVALVRFQRQDA